MINAKLLKDDKEYRDRIESKKVDPILIDNFLEVDSKRGEREEQIISCYTSALLLLSVYFRKNSKTFC